MAGMKFDPAQIYRWTVAAKGIRDAKKGRPREEDCATGPIYPVPTDGRRGVFAKGDAVPAEERTVADSAGVRLSYYEWELVYLAERTISRLLLERWEPWCYPIVAEAKRLVFNLEDPLKEFDTANRRHEAKILRMPDCRRQWCYFPFMGALGLVEVPFNLSAFKILGLGWQETWILAAGPSISSQLIAHHLGITLRRWPDKPDWRTVGLAMLETASLLGMVAAMGVLRAKYIAWTTSSPPDWSIALFTAIFNIIVVVASVATSFFFHDPDGDLEEIVHQKAQSFRRLNKVWKRLARLIGKYDGRRGGTLQRINQVKDDCMAKIVEYRDRNSSHRDDSVPSSFREMVTPEVLFRTRDVGGKLSGILPSLDELISRYRREGPEVLRSIQASLDDLLRRQAGGGMDEIIHSVREENKHNEIPRSVQEGNHEAI